MPKKTFLSMYGPRKCKICKGNIEIVNGYRDGHNAEPIVKGRCCDACNSSIVIGARLYDLFKNNGGK